MQRRVLFILNEPPYGSERTYNGLRLAQHLSERDGVSVQVFMTGDGVLCAKAGQRPPQGWYNLGNLTVTVASVSDVAT